MQNNILIFVVKGLCVEIYIYFLIHLIAWCKWITGERYSSCNIALQLSFLKLVINIAVVVEYVTKALSLKCKFSLETLHWHWHNFFYFCFLEEISHKGASRMGSICRKKIVSMYLCNKRVVDGAAVSSALHEGIGTYFLTIIMSLVGT